jgi:signal transduction histidine kinase
MCAAAESLQARLELVLDERLGALSADQRGFLQVAKKDGQRLLKLLADFREIALAETGQLDLDWGRTDLGAVAKEAGEAVSPRADALGKAVTCSAGEPAAIAADEARVRDAVRRLAQHAVQYSASGSPIELAVSAGEIAIRYEAEAPPPGDALAIAFAAAIAGAHGGSLSLAWTEPSVEVRLAFGGGDATVVPISVAA